MLVSEVLAYNRDDPHLGEVAGRQSEIGGRTSQQILGAARRRGYGVKRNRTYGQYAHLFRFRFQVLVENQAEFLACGSRNLVPLRDNGVGEGWIGYWWIVYVSFCDVG